MCDDRNKAWSPPQVGSAGVSPASRIRERRPEGRPAEQLLQLQGERDLPGAAVSRFPWCILFAVNYRCRGRRGFIDSVRNRETKERSDGRQGGTRGEFWSASTTATLKRTRSPWRGRSLRRGSTRFSSSRTRGRCRSPIACSATTSRRNGARSSPRPRQSSSPPTDVRDHRGRSDRRAAGLEHPHPPFVLSLPTFPSPWR